MGLSKLKNAYNPMAAKANPADVIDINSNQSTLKSWQDSVPVVLLSEYLKKHKDKGMNLYQTPDGRPGLRFSPGLGLGDMKTERWQIAMNTIELLQDAASDMAFLISNKMIELRVLGRIERK